MSALGRFRYDGTFAGWLCVLATAQVRGIEPLSVEVGTMGQGGLFEADEWVEADRGVARRMTEALRRRASNKVVRKLRHALHSEHPGIERAALRVALAVLRDGPGVLADPSFDAALVVHRQGQRVRREVHRMHAFVRFEEHASDGGTRWVATVEPECDVLPLLEDHFVRRFPAMQWSIVDARRRKALCWNGSAARIVRETTPAAAPTPEGEALQQRLWRAYFRAVNIPERENRQLQQRHMPKRYWRHLPEHRPDALDTQRDER